MRHSAQEYTMMFDALLSEELFYSSTSATRANIKAAIKRVLGRSIRLDCILAYSNLVIDENLDVSFQITDPDKDVLFIKLLYGA